jgi:hypothetical protein
LNFAVQVGQVLAVESVDFIDVVEECRSQMNGVLRLSNRWVGSQQSPRQRSDIEVDLNPNHPILNDEILERGVVDYRESLFLVLACFDG